MIGTAKAKDIMAVHCELRRSEKEAAHMRTVFDLDGVMPLF